MAYNHFKLLSIQNPFDVQSFPQSLVAGTSSVLSWTPTVEGTVTIKLFAGASTEMRYISTIAHFIDNKGSFSWTPSIGLEAGDDYALLIVSDADDQLMDCSPFFSVHRPVLKRQEDVSSFMSDFGPPTTAVVATTQMVVASTTEAQITASSFSDTTFVASQSSPTEFSSASVQTTDTPTNAAISSQTAAYSQGGTSTQAATSTQTTTPQSSSGGLSTGAAIGIGVGATVLVLALIGLLIFFLLRRRRQKREQPTIPEVTYTGPAELASGKSGSTFTSKKAELQSGIAQPAMAELSSPPPLSAEEYAELERRKRAAELQGQSMGRAMPTELQGQSHPRAELEALRANLGNVHELGAQVNQPIVYSEYRR